MSEHFSIFYLKKKLTFFAVVLARIGLQFRKLSYTRRYTKYNFVKERKQSNISVKAKQLVARTVARLAEGYEESSDITLRGVLLSERRGNEVLGLILPNLSR